MELRPYQSEGIEATREKFRRGAKRVLKILPTGGGKTVIASEIIRSAEARGSRILFLAHRRELIAQTGDKLRRFGVRHGTIMAGARPAPQLSVQVASIQTLVRRLDSYPSFDLVFLDEAHHAAAGGYQKVLELYPRARVIGLTATPWRLDGRGLADVFDSHVIVRTPKQLRDEGYLCAVGGWEFEAVDTTKARVQGGDFRTKDLEESASSKRVVGDVVEEWMRYSPGKSTVVFAVSIATSRLMAEAFVKAGVRAEHIDGEMHAVERDAIVQRLRSGQTTVVCNCNVLTEGFDVPSIECIVLARPTLSTSLYLQMVGRGLRTWCFGCRRDTSSLLEACQHCGSEAIKRSARIHDHAGCLAAHGHPYAERDWSPESSSKGERRAMEEGEGGRSGGAGRMVCAACKSVRSAYPCDSCGYTPTPEELRLEYEEAAHAKAIADEGSAEDVARRQRVLRYGLVRANPQEWWRFFARIAERCTSKKQVRSRYKWASGETEWPPREWVEALDLPEVAGGTAHLHEGEATP